VTVNVKLGIIRDQVAVAYCKTFGFKLEGLRKKSNK
jgi:hypothetical protein